MSLGAVQTLLKVSWSPPSLPLLGWFSLIQSDQKQHTCGVVDGTVPEVVLVAGEVAVVVVVRGAGVVKEVVMELVGIDGGIGVDAQMLKCFSTVPLGPQYSQ
jgi:hypothetical protein